MSCARYYDREGQPISFEDWGNSMEEMENRRRVAKDELPNGYRVSTVWLGLCHSFEAEHSEHMIFETMVFPPGSYLDLACLRYSSEDAALAGHRRMIEEWKVKEPYKEPYQEVKEKV